MPKKNTAKKEIKNKLETAVYNPDGKVMKKVTLPADVFDVEVKTELLNMAVRIYQANQRLGTHKAKTRGQVTGSTRKIYKQKGTGRARHGDIKAPIFIGGGIAHGPKPRDFSLNLPKRMKRLALFM